MEEQRGWAKRNPIRAMSSLMVRMEHPFPAINEERLTCSLRCHVNELVGFFGGPFSSYVQVGVRASEGNVYLGVRSQLTQLAGGRVV